MENIIDPQKKYFDFAYQTGSDVWTHIPYAQRAMAMLPTMNTESLILDIGSGRGLWMMKLVKNAYRTLGIDYIESIVESLNQTIKNEGYENQARCVLGNATNIPFTDSSFDAATDIGTFQHLTPEQWSEYISETARILKHHGYYLNVSLSKKTNRFLGFTPKKSTTGSFEKFGVHYYFFDEGEIAKIFGERFNIIDQQFEPYASPTEPGDDLVLVFTLMQKK